MNGKVGKLGPDESVVGDGESAIADDQPHDVPRAGRQRVKQSVGNPTNTQAKIGLGCGSFLFTVVKRRRKSRGDNVERGFEQKKVTVLAGWLVGC